MRDLAARLHVQPRPLAGAATARGPVFIVK
jgi:hypothetical protein